jgi:hypothetical protein
MKLKSSSIFYWGKVKQLKVDVDIYRLYFFGLILSCATFIAVYFDIQGVPLIHIELFLLAGFLRTRFGLFLILSSFVIACSRVVQGFLGFDQIFVSIYLLFRNFINFPVNFLINIFISILVVFFIIYAVLKIIPKNKIIIKVNLIFIIFSIIVAAKASEDFFRTNIIGSSFGYIYGQIYFANMLNSAYSTPDLNNQEYPGSVGARIAIEKKYNYLLIIVESLGLPKNENDTKEIFSSFKLKKLTDKYDVQIGFGQSRGSTIHGEIRQLCNGKLKNGLFGVNNDCIPFLFKKSGYVTRAVHANYSHVYGRDIWYPNVGFDFISASDTETTLAGKSENRWGTALDYKTINWAVDLMDSSSELNFTYILTISTHLPAILLPNTEINESCIKFNSNQSCIHLSNLKSVLTYIANSAEKLNNTLIVVTGDHPPPFVNLESRNSFSASEVPWVILKPL